MKRKNLKGFTLVELLIVIALIAILSVAILATLNPIEQINKARDARVQNDASEVLSAYERYFASKGQYPWVTYEGLATGGLTIAASDFVALRSDTFGFGVCHGSADGLAVNAASDATNCDPSDANQNVLISTGELKTSMIGRDEFAPVLDGTKIEQALWAVKAADADTVYVCYIPKSIASRNDTTKMKCITSTTGVVSSIGGTCLGTVTDWSAPVLDGTEAMFRCIPE